MRTAPRTLLTTIAVLLALIVAPAAARAQTDLPLGEDHGVRLVLKRGAAVLVFGDRSAKLRERINSRYAWISCTELGDPFTSVGSGNLDAPRHGRRVRTGFNASGADFCLIFLRAHTVRRGHQSEHVGRRVLLSFPLTQAGAVYLDEASKAATMFTIGLVATLSKPKRVTGEPTYAEVIEGSPKLAKVLAPLAAPGDTPPPKKVGYYSDGAEHMVLAMVSAAGKRLFIERAAGGLLTTNVAEYLFGDLP